MHGAERELEGDGEHQVTPLELFFDLTFVFALTQVTALLADNPTWAGVFRGMLVLAALWWAWSVYAWLTSATDVDEGGVRLVMLAAMGAMFGVALAVPGSFGDDAVLFGIAYLVVRLLHLVLSATVARDDPDRRSALLRFVPTAVVGPMLLVLAGFLEGDWRITVWLVALGIDYLGPVVVGVGRGWRVASEHFAERHGLIVLIALGESIIAIGLGAGLDLDVGVLVSAALGIVVVSALWWLYFDVAAIFARRQLMQATGLELHRLALQAYSYLHLPIIAGVVLFAFGLEATLHHPDQALETVTAVALCGGAALYLLGEVLFLRRTMGRVFRRRTAAVVVLLALIPAATAIPALAALALVSAVCSLVVGYEAIARREHRVKVRHPELAERGR
ncbi:MAG TPA: low temperature requirement protein A [Gaiellaceae bacterium]|nr:low temperature requirement protein A [Gaiellaceae bacterium]